MATHGSLRQSSVRFDLFRVDLSSGELFRSGLRVPIQDQPLQLLRLLLEAEGRVVTREQLRAALWPQDTFVDFEHAVNTAVRKLRQALEDSAEHPKFVETFPRIGYRFIATVEWVPEVSDNNPLPRVVAIAPPGPVPDPEKTPRKRAWNLKVTAAIATLVVITSVVFLSKENSHLSRNVVGAWIRRSIVGSPNVRPAFRERRLTANPDDIPLMGGVISPDGNYLAYTDAGGFYLRQVGSGETRLVTFAKGFDPFPESWFPDSVHLLVTWIEPHKGPPSLWRISVLGGTPLKIAEVASSARVSPDGSQIAFLKGKWDCEQIWLMQADGSGARRLIDGGNDTFGAVAWAPDSRRFAYFRAPDGSGSDRKGNRVEIYDLPSGHSEVILPEPRIGGAIAWLNSGRLIYTLGETEPNQGNSDSNPWWVQLDARTGRPSSPPVRIGSDHGDVAEISVTTDGKRMALLRSSYQSDAYLAELQDQGKRLSALRRFTLDDRSDFPSAWTADSQTVLFASDRDGRSHIFRQHINETQPELLVGGNDNLGAPRLAPDGLSVLYLIWPLDPSANRRLMRISLAGGPSQFILEGAGIFDPQCARLPSTICIYGQMEPGSEYFRFFTFDPAGTKRTEIVAARIKKEDADSKTWWSVSPDGRYLVNSRSQNPYRYKGAAVRIVNLVDGTQRYITVPGAGLLQGMAWAVDSKSVWVGAYINRSARGTHSGVFNVAVTGNVNVAFKGTLTTLLPVPSPDGRRLALWAITRSSNMWLLENF